MLEELGEVSQTEARDSTQKEFFAWVVIGGIFIGLGSMSFPTVLNGVLYLRIQITESSSFIGEKRM